MFLNYDKVVLSLFIILFRIVFFSFDSVCFGLCGCVLLDFVAFPYSEVGGSFRLGCFCLLIVDMSGTVLLSCSVFIFWCISSISRSKNQHFFIMVLTRSASLWLVVWKLAHSCRIIIIIIIIIIIYSFEFFTWALAVTHWSLSDSTSPPVSGTRLGIPAVLSNAVVWIVSTRPPISKSTRPFNNPLVIVPKAPIPIGTIVTFMFHSFFNSLARSRYLSSFSNSFRFILWSAGIAKSTILQMLFFFLAEIRWSVCMSKSHRSLCVIF